MVARIRIKHLRSVSRRPCIIMDRGTKIRAPCWCIAVKLLAHSAHPLEIPGIVIDLSARRSLGHIRVASLYSRPLPSPRATDGPPDSPAPHFSRPYFCAAEILVGAGLHRSAALRHGDGRRNIPHGDVLAGRGSGAVERRLCTALAPAHRRPLWQQSVSAAALLSVSSLHQALAGRLSRTLPRFAQVLGLRPADSRHPLRRGQLGIANFGRLGIGGGGVAERHGSLAIHLLPA